VLSLGERNSDNISRLSGVYVVGRARMLRAPYAVANQCSDSVAIHSRLKSPMTTIALWHL